jgi:hypothetical protein
MQGTQSAEAFCSATNCSAGAAPAPAAAAPAPAAGVAPSGPFCFSLIQYSRHLQEGVGWGGVGWGGVAWGTGNPDEQQQSVAGLHAPAAPGRARRGAGALQEPEEQQPQP